ncbi:MAG: hypothetical protein MUE44_28350 [Oscillatoriaceae cyanobacterium Prado104]|jgi:hypothetical protein|nr:hypothetical protein [Oscillatoriaceae cyanobacterium Prado104]
MQTEISDIELPIDADIIALDKDDRIVALIEVKIIEAKEKAEKQKIADYMIDWLKAALAKMSELRTVIPYAMFIDTEQILIFKWDGVNLSAPVGSLNTAEILRYYYAGYGSQQVFEDTIETLVESWLHDLAYHWKSAIPPASEQIAAIGLLPLLAGGTTRSGVKLGGNFIYRDQLFDDYCYGARS